mgnify:CR=1 FL=1
MISDIYNQLTPKEKYLIAKYGFNMARGYLRGTKAFQSRRAPTLSNKVTRLERQVNRQRPEKIHWIDSTNTFHALGQKSIDFDVTRLFINSTRFRDDITGDKWYNHSIDLRLKFDTPINGLRVVIYTPKRSGTTTAGLTTGYTSFTAPLDPTAFIVHLDRAINSNYNSEYPFLRFYAKLNSLTQYNSEADILDRNNIRVAILYEASNAGNIYYSWDLMVTNK